MKTRPIFLALACATLIATGITTCIATGVSAQELPSQQRELSPFSLDLPQSPVVENRHYLSYNLLGITTNPINLGYEWRRDENFGLKVSLAGGFSPFVSLVNLSESYSLGGRIEARWYQFDRLRPLYMGVGLGVNTYRAKDDSYYDYHDYSYVERDFYDLTLFTPQLVLGYFHRTRHRISWDFNVGVGFLGWREKDNYDPSVDSGFIAIPLPVHLGISMTWETGRNPIRYQRY